MRATTADEWEIFLRWDSHLGGEHLLLHFLLRSVGEGTHTTISWKSEGRQNPPESLSEFWMEEALGGGGGEREQDVF